MFSSIMQGPSKSDYRRQVKESQKSMTQKIWFEIPASCRGVKFSEG